MKIETRKLSRLEPWMHLAANCLGDDNELQLNFSCIQILVVGCQCHLEIMILISDCIFCCAI